MARTKQTARRSTGGKAPRKQLATSASRELRTFLTSQQVATSRDGGATERTSFINCENVLGSFRFGVEPTSDMFAPRFHTAKVVVPQTGVEEQWLGVQWASKLDGPGMSEHGRPSLSLVLSIDISGSMSLPLEGDEGEMTSKLEVAKRCVGLILDQLTAADEVSVLLFNHDSHLLQPMASCTSKLRNELKCKLAAVRPGGGTRLHYGFEQAMRALAASKGREGHALSRVYFLTDMLSGPNDEKSVLDHALQRATASMHTTVVGVGVDLSTGTVECLAALPGGKYMSVMNAAEFQRSVGHEFSHDVVPTAFNVKLRLSDGYTFERACGSAELNGLVPGSAEVMISSEFAAQQDADGLSTGGMLVFKLRAPGTTTEGASAQTRRSMRGATRVSGLRIDTTWESAQGLPQSVSTAVGVPLAVAPPSSPALRKAIALVRFVDLQAAFCAAGDGDSLAARLTALQNCRDGRVALLNEMRAVGDTSMGEGDAESSAPNASFLQTLDQIIEMETRETAALQAAEAAAVERREAEPRTRSRKRTRDATGTASERKTKEEPQEFLCPITKMRMTDPVCTVDGHTFERKAIEQWLTTNSTSPLTGLRLSTKALAPNHILRALLAK